jgi:uncharacterized membrane protein
MSVSLVPLVAEIGAFAIAGAVFYGLKMRFGWTIALSFLVGSIFWTTPLETLGILTGSYSYTAFAGSLFPGYKGYLVWIGVVPLWIEMGWFIVSASSFMIFHEVLMSKRRAVVAAAVAGLFAVNLDLMIDPVASSNNLWVWLGPSVNFLGIPVYNYVGWFIMIFFYDIIIWSTVIGFRRMKGLSIIEAKLLSIKMYVGQVSLKKRVAGFVFRMAIFEVVAILLIKVASVVL